MILLLGVVFFALYGIALDAQTLPALYDVEGVPYTHSLIARSSFCTDGMSDRELGMSALIHLKADEGNYVHQGCCTFQPQQT